MTVSARLTGAIGSSSNPISGMTISTLLLTCLIFLSMDRTTKADTLTALIISAVVCVASSNGGTTAQDLKTGQLVGATPRFQQYAILIGALTSALVMGWTLIMLNQWGTIYTKNPAYVPQVRLPVESLKDLAIEKAGGEYAEKDTNDYYALHVKGDEIAGVKPGKYLVDKEGVFQYYIDPRINGRISVPISTKSYEAVDETRANTATPIPPNYLLDLPLEVVEEKKLKLIQLQAGSLPNFQAGGYLVDDQGIVKYRQVVKTENLRLTDSEAGDTKSAATKGIEAYEAPKTRLMQIIIDGVLNRKLPWSLVLIGALIAVAPRTRRHSGAAVRGRNLSLSGDLHADLHRRLNSLARRETDEAHRSRE
ncbi:MAG: OPT/YSL family transporter [Pirellulales bacterium]